MTVVGKTRIKDLMAMLGESGYTSIRFVAGVGWCGVARCPTTARVCLNLDGEGYYERRFCFDTVQNAELFLRGWDGLIPPVVGDDGCVSLE